MELVFREAQEVDREKIVALCSEVYEETRSMRNKEPFQQDHWLWQNWDGGPVPGVITIAQEAKEVCGVFSMPGRMLLVDGQPVKSGVVQSLVTKKTHRGRGVFIKMGLRALEKAPLHGIDLCYSFPNNRSINGFTVRLGFRQVATIPTYIKLHPVAWAWGLARKPLRSLGWSMGREAERRDLREGEGRIVLIGEFDGRFQRLWERARHAHRISLIRDPNYLSWRFKDKSAPSYNVLACVVHGEVEAYIVYRFARILSLPACVIMDFLSAEEALPSLSLLIRRVDERARSVGAAVTMASFKAKEPFVQAFRKAGFFTVPSRLSVRPLNLVARATSTRLQQEEDILDPSSWFVTLADWDVL